MIPKISVIMSVYYESIKELSRSIESILSQTYKDFEYIIILDNPSNIEAKECILEHQKLDQRIIFIENQKNIKLWASLNKWLSIARWKYIARMDGDDSCLADRLEKQYDFFEENPEIDILFTGWREINEWGDVFVRTPKKRFFENIEKYFFLHSLLLHPSLMCRSEVFWSYRYPEIGRPEDFPLFLDWIHEGYTFSVLEEALYDYTVQESDIETKYKKVREFSQTFLEILIKKIPLFWNNIYYYAMLLRIVVEFLLSRVYFIFKTVYVPLQKRIKSWWEEK